MSACSRRGLICLLLALCLCLSACALPFSPAGAASQSEGGGTGADSARYLVAVDDEPDTADFQCTSVYYTVALCSFNRLVETQIGPDGETRLVPSLLESWNVSRDGITYSFVLREGLYFSNGSPLTSDDVLYTITRMLTHPDACNRDLFRPISGADRLESGESDWLRGFYAISDREFIIELEQPFGAFLASLSTPGASILDRETTEAAGDRFGRDPAWTVGTGPFIWSEWRPAYGLLFTANPACWQGVPLCGGLDLRFVTDAEAQRLMFERGELDILDLDNIGMLAEFFKHGDIYQDRLVYAPQVSISYIALNAALPPLDDVRVRRALQLSLDRQTLLDAVFSSEGSLENGIFPHGLTGFNADLPAIPYDPEQARALLTEAGYPNGFNLTVSVSANSSASQLDLTKLAAAMWEKIGIRTTVTMLEEKRFLPLRMRGQLACYTATWSADYNDPDNFIYTFFGSAENTRSRSLCYQDEAVIRRVNEARSIVDAAQRLREYAALERRIVQDDASWIPLFSHTRCYVLSERVEHFALSWNGWYEPCYADMQLKGG